MPSLRRQLVLLGASLFVGIGALAVMALDALDSPAFWRSAGLTGLLLAALLLCLRLAWRMVGRCFGILDDLATALEHVAAGNLSQRLDGGDSDEMRRVASAFNLAAQNSARQNVATAAFPDLTPARAGEVAGVVAGRLADLIAAP